MGVFIRYRVPYEMHVRLQDLGSGKIVTNNYYLQCGIQTVAPPAYGSPIAGPGDNAVMTAAFAVPYVVNIHPVFNANAKLLDITSRAIIGKRYKTPIIPVLLLVPGAPILVQTSTPHGYATGDKVLLVGVTLPVSANGQWTITVTSTTEFTLNGSAAAGVWSGDGVVQKIAPPFELEYADKYVYPVPGTPVGGVAGDAMPLFTTCSMRRQNVGVGKSWRSRLSLSPFSETDVKDGAFLAARITAINAAFLAFYTTAINNSGTDPGSQIMANVVLSKKIAFGLPSPFTDASLWVSNMTGFTMQPNMGSVVKRKPKLTVPIA